MLNLNSRTNQWDIDRYLNNNIEKYANTPAIANQFKALGGFKNSAMEDVRQNIINAYNVFEESTNPAFRNYIQTSMSGGKKMLADIDKQRQFVEQYYWPGGEAEKAINEYVTKYGDSLAAKSAQAQSLAKNTWIRSGASQSAIRAWVAQQQALDVDNLIKFQENKVNSLTNLYNQYNTLISGLRAEASTANQAYILQPLATILERQQTIASALVQNEAQLNSLRLSTGSWTTTWNASLDAFNQLISSFRTAWATDDQISNYLNWQWGMSVDSRITAWQQKLNAITGVGAITPKWTNTSNSSPVWTWAYTPFSWMS